MIASTKHSVTVPATKSRPNRVLVLRVAAVALGVAIIATIAWTIHFLFFAGVNPGPSFIEELRTGAITESDIKRIEILKFDPGAGWPFSERDYARKARKRIATPRANELVRILRVSTTNGYKPRNHPATFYYGILRIDLVDGAHYYVFYSLGCDNGGYYASVKASSKDSTNSNGAKDYENVPLAEFLKQNDPWYRNLDSPPSSYRPSFPDNVP